MAEVKEITPAGGVGDQEEPSTVVPHLVDGIVSDILRRLPSKDAYRLAVVCRRWHEIVFEPVFLSQHLAPRPPPLLNDGPYALIIQPRRTVGYAHLTLVATDPADDINLNLPLHPKYIEKEAEKPRPAACKKPRRPARERGAPPTPALLDTAAENFVLSSLYSTGDDADEVDVDDEVPELSLIDLLIRSGGAAADDKAVDDDVVSGTGAVLVNKEAEEEEVEVGDYVVFFERTVAMLDISFVASHGRLLLARSRTRYYICDPAANRWLVLPPPASPPAQATAWGFHYDLDAATGQVSFTVVLLAGTRGRRVRAETFSTTTDVPGAAGAARRLPAASPGISVGTCFYWLCHRGHVVRYDASRGRASVVRDPPQAEGSKGRMWRSLGSAGGLLRLCMFDIRDEHASMLPHEDIEGVHGVWVMDDAAAGGASWRRVHEAVVEDISAYYFNLLYNHELALDFAGACSDCIIVNKERTLLRHDLETGDKVELSTSLSRNGGKLHGLYRCFHLFPFFRA